MTPPREEFYFLAYAWDITAAKERAANEPTGNLIVPEWRGVASMVDVDQGHAATVNLSEPLIVVPIDDAGHFPVDGWHRIYRALREGVPALKAVILTTDEERQIHIYGGDAGHPLRRSARAKPALEDQ
ncbi:hypothetical protein [Streptosporangium sp. NPDC001681]|uniref:hypothetical protein n=1 Tax=Streptosporangium sp. NPDC001681 TaxID=3154395 RepID=UPI00331ABD8D